jgi:hypothetical protein
LLVLDQAGGSGGSSRIGSVTARQPASAQEARQITSIWSSLNFINLEYPGMNTYYKTLTPSSQRWAFEWCGKDEAHFHNILAPFSITFYIDDMPVSSSSILQYDLRDICRVWVTILDGWQSGTRMKLDIRYHLSAPIEGGHGMRDIGDYTQRIYVTVN